MRVFSATFKALVLATILMTGSFSQVHAAANQHANSKSTYERVTVSNTLRCAYYIWPPLLSRDANTGAISGLSHDMIEAMAQLLGLKVEWVAEVNFDAMFEGYVSGRYDMLCAPIFSTPARARASDFSRPFAFMAYYLYARADDMRFDADFTAANAADITYASLDGDMNAILGAEEFPLTKKFSIGQNAASTDPLMAITTGKADVACLEPVAANGFMAANPGKIRQAGLNPVRVSPLTFSVPPGDERFKVMINMALETLIYSGSFDKMLKQYPEFDATLLRLAPEYVLPKKKAE